MYIKRNDKFEPDWNHLLEVVYNRRPERLPLYEHHIDPGFISQVLGEKMDPAGLSPGDMVDYYRKVIAFWADCTYDGFDYEAAVCEIFPEHGAILGGLGPIQTREDFDRYPFDELPGIFWETYTPHLEAIRKVMLEGMKAYGGCGYGIFESAQDLAGYTTLCTMQYEDPELFRDLFLRIGDLYVTLWSEMVDKYSDVFVFFRMGDDLGFKTNTLLEPETIRQHILPQYKKVIDIVHRAGKKFLLHSCGHIFDIMEDLIALGIDAKHSNEDQIAPFMKWVENYSDRIGLFGGFDMNILALEKPDEIYHKVIDKGELYRRTARGYGLGSGNSIPDYIPPDGFFAMVEAVKTLRRKNKMPDS